MNNKLLSLLLAVCVPLVLIITVEWLFAMHSREAALSSQASNIKNTAPSAMPSLDLSASNEENYDQLVSRPLFLKGRRPVPETATDSSQNAIVQANFDWQLSGVYFTPKGPAALFNRATTKVPKDNFRRITLDGNLDGWKLAEITKDKVVLTLADNKKELPLFKAKPKLTTQPNLPAIPPPGAEPQPETPDIQPEEELIED
ncbi:hypothetical protein JCM14076_12270 [Methylosoma difficile]